VPTFEDGEVSIYYEEFGSGYPVLLFAPGSLNSSIEWWRNKGPAPFDPTEVFAADFRLIAMDQRNAGQSRAPIRPTDGWHSYAADHIALMDHLGIDRAHVMGACIGASFCPRLMQDVPERITAGVLQQPIGLEQGTSRGGDATLERWKDSLPAGRRPSDEVAAAFAHNLYAPGFVYSVSRDFVRGCHKPMLVLPGNDRAHPEAIAREIAQLAPRAEVLDEWRTASPAVIDRVRQFLKDHAPR